MNNLFDVQYFLQSFPELFSRLNVTVGISVGSFLIGLVIGLLVAMVRIYKVRVLKWICGLYVSFIRGTPLLVQLYLITYGIPRIILFLQSEYGYFSNFNSNAIGPLFYGMVAFSLNLGAYLSETIRSSIEAINIGQFEASKSIGMTTWQMMRRIIIPQALKVAIPNLSNMLICTIKDTSLVFMVGIIDIMGQAKISGARSLKLFEVYVSVSLIYWVVCIVLEQILKRVEMKMKSYEKAIG